MTQSTMQTTTLFTCTVSLTKTHGECAYEPCKEKFAMVGRNDKYCCSAHRTAAANERRKGKR